MIGGLVTLVAGHLVETAKLRAWAAALYAGAAASLLVAFVFALVALRRWIAATYSANYPELWIAAGFIAIALPFIGFGVWMQQRKAETQPATALALIAAPTAARLAMRGASKVSPRALAVGVVLIAGVALGRRLIQR